MVIRILLPAVMLLTLVAALVGHSARAETSPAVDSVDTESLPESHQLSGIQVIHSQIIFTPQTTDSNSDSSGDAQKTTTANE